MKKCYSNCGINHHNIFKKMYTCFYCSCPCCILNYCHSCHCPCHSNDSNFKNTNFSQITRYNSVSPSTFYGIQRNILSNPKENKSFNFGESKINKNFYSNYNLNNSKDYYLDDMNKSKNILGINKDLVNRTRNLANEIKELREKIKNEKDNLFNIIKYETISNNISFKKSRFNKSDDHERKYNQNKLNFYKEYKNNNLLKRIYLPKIINGNSLLKNENNDNLSNRNPFIIMILNLKI